MDPIANIFYNPKTGFIDLPSLYEKLQEAGYNFKYNDVKNWYQNQQINQIYKKPMKIRSYNKIISHYNQIGELQADLMDLKKFSRHNHGYKYILNIIDIFSRYAWSFPLKTKSPTEIAPYIDFVFKQIPKNNYKALCTDNGKEFMGEVNEILQKYNVKKFLNDPNALNQHNKMAMIERFNYTMLNRIKKLLNYYNTLNYVDYLNDLVMNYNNTKHSTIQKKPIDVFNGKEYPIKRGISTSEINKKIFQIGDQVRFLKVKKTFDKHGFIPSYSQTIHTITKINNNKYQLENGKDYYPEELVKVSSIATNPIPENIETFDELYEKNKKIEKFEKKQREEFLQNNDEVQKQIIEGKRTRKPVIRYS